MYRYERLIMGIILIAVIRFDKKIYRGGNFNIMNFNIEVFFLFRNIRTDGFIL